MRVTKKQLVQIIKEEVGRLQQADPFSDRLSLSNSIRDGIIDHLESEKFFEMGAIPQSVIKVVENCSLQIADALKEESE